MTLVLALPPAIDAFTRRAIRYCALHAVACGERAIVLDAAGTASADVTGVDLLVNVHRAVRAFGGRVVLAGVTEPVRAALALAGADQLLEVAPTVEAARAAAAPAPRRRVSDRHEVHRDWPPDYAPPLRRPTGRYAVDVARFADEANIAAVAMDIVDRVARDGGPAILPHHAWTAMGELHQGLLLQRAQHLGVPLAVALPTE